MGVRRPTSTMAVEERGREGGREREREGEEGGGEKPCWLC